MSLASGARLGPYEILSPLGAGGMGEVYRAKDTRLDRTVAIKVLPSHLSENAELRQRFEREAKTISSLSHPHICALYDVGHQDGVDYLVMEFLEGETLAEKLARGPLATEQLLRYGIEMTDALDKAHRQGIVHRDLKPGNVMLTKSGVKLLDFGLAKAIARAPDAVALSSLPTREKELTAEGTILGTFQYMAPEQLERKEADARTDIFAFGAVLYEMATGKKAFTGKSQASLIAAILDSEPPPISTIQPMMPPALDRVVKTCLAKDPEDRWQTAHDVMLELKWVAEGGSQAGIHAPLVARRKSRERLGWILFAAAALGLAVLASLFVASRREPPRLLQSSLLAPEKSQFNFNAGPMALSPDGHRLALVATTSDGKNLLWVMPLNGLAAQPLAGTEGATYPFWSPDSRFLGFFAAGKLKKIEASGGPPETICDAASGRGGSWSRDGVIVFTPTNLDPVYRVSSSGGPTTPVTQLDASRREVGHRWPFFLPDGRHFLYLVFTASTGESSKNGIYVGSLDSKKSELLLQANSSMAYAPAGYLLFWRENTIMAQPFNAKRRQLAGQAFPVAEHVQYVTGYASAIFSVSENGLLAYKGGSGVGLSQLAWLDRSGHQMEALGVPVDYDFPRLSHDGLRVAVDIADAQTGNRDIWLYDLSRRTQSRFTFDPALDLHSIWSPDDSRIVFGSNRKGPHDLYQKVTTGTGSEEVLLTSAVSKQPTDWSADGRYIAFESRDLKAKTGWDLWILSVQDRKATPFLRTEFDEFDGQFSPDGRWMAYTSNESGKNEVYVQSFPGPGGKWQVSTAGGSYPRWRRDGKELFYVAPGNKLMSVEVKTGAMFEAGVPRLLFASPMKRVGRPYDVSSDGQRFLINLAVGEESSRPITLIQNWTAGIKR